MHRRNTSFYGRLFAHQIFHPILTWAFGYGFVGGVGWLAYALMRFVTGEDCRRTWGGGGAALHEVGIQCVVEVRGPTLWLLLVLHFAIHTHFGGLLQSSM